MPATLPGAGGAGSPGHSPYGSVPSNIPAVLSRKWSPDHPNLRSWTAALVLALVGNPHVFPFDPDPIDRHFTRAYDGHARAGGTGSGPRGAKARSGQSGGSGSH